MMKYILTLITILCTISVSSYASQSRSLGYVIKSEDGEINIIARCDNSDQSTWEQQPWKCDHLYSINKVWVRVKIENNEYAVEVVDASKWHYSLKENGTIVSGANPKSYKDFTLSPIKHSGSLLFKITLVASGVPQR
jgi:hypothetical protein